MSREKRKKRRKIRNKDRDVPILNEPTPHSFSGKARKGDLATISFTFSGIKVPYDAENPNKDLVLKKETY